MNAINNIVSTDYQSEENLSEVDRQHEGGTVKELWNSFIIKNSSSYMNNNDEGPLKINLASLRHLLTKTVQMERENECPLTLEDLENLHNNIRNEIKKKRQQCKKPNLKCKHISRKSFSLPKASRNRNLQSKIVNVSNFNEFLDNYGNKELRKLKTELLKLKSKLKQAGSLEHLKKLEKLIQMKDIECNTLSKKVNSLKNFVKKRDCKKQHSYENKKHRFLKEINQLQKETQHYEQMKRDIGIKIARKDQTLKRHCEIIETLDSKYTKLCKKFNVKKDVIMRKTKEGLIEVTFPPGMKVSKKVIRKKEKAERNLQKIWKMEKYQRNFAERVRKKDIPNLLKWYERHKFFHKQIRANIEVCEKVYERYKSSQDIPLADDKAIVKFLKLKEKYSKEYKVDNGHLDKIEKMIADL